MMADSSARGTVEAVQPLFEPAQFRALRRLIGKLLHWRFRIFQQRRVTHHVLEHVAGTPLLVIPGVLHPTLMRTGEFFASELTALFPPGLAVLDMGTGSGICAVSAARVAASVVAVDISPAAVRCARANVLLNELDDCVQVVHGDLFAPVGQRRFDVILFNPPFLRGTPRDDADRAWRSVDVAERFAAELGSHLQPDGYALVLLSTVGDAQFFVEEFKRNGFAREIVARKQFVNETLIILKLRRI